MNRFNRDFATVGINGRIWHESHSREACEQVQRDLGEYGVKSEVVQSDLPQSAGATRKR